MKTLLITLVLLTSTLVLAQEKEVTKTNNTVKITTYHDNGVVAQTGHQYLGKNHGIWKSFDKDGNPVAVGEYQNGEKVGTWLFWTQEQIAQVDYQKNQIQNVSYWESLSEATTKMD